MKKKFKKVVKWKSDINWDTLWFFIPVLLFTIPTLASSIKEGFFGYSLIGVSWHGIMGGILSSLSVLVLFAFSLIYFIERPKREVYWEQIK